MRLNATCFIPKVTASGQAGNLTSVSHAGTLIDGTEATSNVGRLGSVVDDCVLLRGNRAVGRARTLHVATEVSVPAVEAKGHTESFRLPTLTKYPRSLFPSANMIKSSVRLFGVGAKGQTNTLRCATTHEHVMAVAA